MRPMRRRRPKGCAPQENDYLLVAVSARRGPSRKRGAPFLRSAHSGWGRMSALGNTLMGVAIGQADRARPLPVERSRSRGAYRAQKGLPQHLSLIHI